MKKRKRKHAAPTPLPTPHTRLELAGMIGKSIPRGTAIMFEYKHDPGCFAPHGGDCRCNPTLVIKPFKL